MLWTSVSNIQVVGELKKQIGNMTIERMTQEGAWVIVRDSQDKGFWNFPGKPLVLLTGNYFLPGGKNKDSTEVAILLFQEDRFKPEIAEEIQRIMFLKN